jgi:hypothetical protein
VVDCCEQGNEPPGSTKCGVFHDTAGEILASQGLLCDVSLLVS